MSEEEMTSSPSSFSKSIPQEAILKATSRSVVDDLASLQTQNTSTGEQRDTNTSNNKNTAVSTSRDSYYIASLVDVGERSITETTSFKEQIRSFYNKLDLRKVRRKSATAGNSNASESRQRSERVDDDNYGGYDFSSKEIPLCVVCESHRDVLKAGLLALRETRVDQFWRTVNSNHGDEKSTLSPSLAIPSSYIRRRHSYWFHPQFDVDRDKYSLDIDDRILTSSTDRLEFAKVWKKFVTYSLVSKNGSKYTTRSGDDVSRDVEISFHRDASRTGGVHVFVRGVKIRLKHLRELVRCAASNKEIAEVLEKHGLRIDTPSSILIPYNEKSGNKDLVYDVVSFVDDDDDCTSLCEPFPICFCKDCVAVKLRRSGDEYASSVSSKSKWRNHESRRRDSHLTTSEARGYSSSTSLSYVKQKEDTVVDKDFRRRFDSPSRSLDLIERKQTREEDSRLVSKSFSDERNKNISVSSSNASRGEKNSASPRKEDAASVGRDSPSPFAENVSRIDPYDATTTRCVASHYTKTSKRVEEKGSYRMDDGNPSSPPRNLRNVSSSNASLKFAKENGVVAKICETICELVPCTSPIAADDDDEKKAEGNEGVEEEDDDDDIICLGEVVPSSNEEERPKSERSDSEERRTTGKVDSDGHQKNVQSSFATEVREGVRNAPTKADIQWKLPRIPATSRGISPSREKSGNDDDSFRRQISDKRGSGARKSSQDRFTSREKRKSPPRCCAEHRDIFALPRPSTGESRPRDASRKTILGKRSRNSVSKHRSLNRESSISSSKRSRANDTFSDRSLLEENARRSNVGSPTFSTCDDSFLSDVGSAKKRTGVRSRTGVGNVLDDTHDSIHHYDRFLPDKIMPTVFGQNILCLAVYDHVFPLMFEQLSLAVAQAETFTYLRRYTHYHLSTVLVTYALVLWNRHPDAKKLETDCKQFCISLTHAIVNKCAKRAEADLKLLWRELHSSVDSTLQTVSIFVNDKTPTMAEIIFSMLHLALWSSSSPSKTGIPLNNGEYVAVCPLVVGIVKEYLRDRRRFFARQMDVDRDNIELEVPIIAKMSAQAQAMQRVLNWESDTTLLDRLVSFLLALAYPYDGNMAWTNNKYPAWSSISEDVYKSRVLEPARYHISQIVCTCVNMDSLPQTVIVGSKPDSVPKPKTHKIALSLTFELRSVADLWRPLHQKIQFPPELLMTSDHRIFAIATGEELRNIPCLRTVPAFATGTGSDLFRRVNMNAENIVVAFSIFVSDHVKKCSRETYLSYPDAEEKLDTKTSHRRHASGVVDIRRQEVEKRRSELSDTSSVSYNRPSAIGFDARIREICSRVHFSQTMAEHWLPDFYRGCLSLFELFGTTANVEKVIRFHREVKYRGRRKKVALCFSSEPNHGKSTCAKIFNGLYRESCYALSFAAMSAESDANMTNSALVGAAGKMLTFIDEIPAGGRNRSSQLSMHKIKTLTGGTSSTGYRELYTNSCTQFYNCAVVTFSNNLPQLSETGDADVQRLFPIEFPRQFPITDDNNGLNRKIELTYTALDTIMLALEFCVRRAPANGDGSSKAAFSAYVEAMDCRTYDGSLFTLDDDIKDMDPRTCPNYDECMKNYNEETRIVLSFVAHKITQFKLHEWGIIRDWFETTVRTVASHKASRLDAMLEKLREHYNKHRQQYGTIANDVDDYDDD